jgi:polyferredoxin
MDAVLTSLMIAAGGAVWAIICTLGLRSDWYTQSTIESGMRWNRRPVTPDQMAQIVRISKTVLIIGIVMGVAIAVVGVITMLIGVATVLSPSS